MMNVELQDLENLFSYHPPQGDQPERYEAIRKAGRALAMVVCMCCPPSRERSVAVTNIQQAVMMANAAIACHGQTSYNRRKRSAK